jgi:CBS domain containing-hemolysin-like protein
MSWIKRLQSRWKVGSAFQVIIILVVFACTGMTVVYLMKPVLRSFFGENIPLWARIVYAIIILPIYNVFLLAYGLVFGQFHFFWNFEKRFFGRLLGSARKNKEQNP